MIMCNQNFKVIFHENEFELIANISNFNIFCSAFNRSRQRVFATAESRREQQSDEVEREVVIKKTVHNVNMTNLSDTAVTASYDSSASRYINSPEFSGLGGCF